MSHARTARTSLLVAAVVVAAAVPADHSATAGDPIGDEVARWKQYLEQDTVTVGFGAQVKQSAAPALATAEEALSRGRRSFALLRLGNVRTTLEPGLYPATHSNPSFDELDAERAKLAPRFDPKTIAVLAKPSNTSALGRALAQSSAMQGRETFDASLSYGHATEPLFGIYYLAQGVAYLDYSAFAAKAGASLAPARARAPALRSIAPEIRALRTEMLEAYRPPLSIDRHSEYIGASSATKEALEYDAAGYHEAALLRYLQAAVRFAPLRAGLKALDGPALAARTDEWRKRLAEPGVDHSIGQLFFEVGAGDADTARAGHAIYASAVLEDVLPRYVAALAPAAPTAITKPAEVTVTLVRWPYT